MQAESAKGKVKLPVLITLGNPNTGKSTLFNALTGMRQKVGNFPGVTVEHLRGKAQIGGREIIVVDLPGTYSLAAQSPDEMVAIDVLLGRVEEIGKPNAVIVVVDANNLRRNLFLASQVLELPLPMIVVLNMMDLAESRNTVIDIERLASMLGAPVIPMCATSGEGLQDLQTAVDAALHATPAARPAIDQVLNAAAFGLAAELNDIDHPVSAPEVERALIDVGGYAECRLLSIDPTLGSRLEALRKEIGQGRSLATLEARNRYAWINKVVNVVEQRELASSNRADFIDKVLNHPVFGSLIFVLTMAVVFQSVFAWAAPVMDFIDTGSGTLGAVIDASVTSPLLASFLSDGIIAGVGSVIVFLPQIIILFGFIILLEDTGYMSRAAFLMDRLMRWCGLSGQSFIPMLSSFSVATHCSILSETS